MRRIALVYFDAGGGHRNAAMALEQVLQQSNLRWEVHLVNLQEILDELDIVRRLTGLRIQDAYNRMLQNGWTLGSPQLLRVLQGIIRLYHGKTVRLLERYWQGLRPDLAVSLVPHFNRALCESLRKACPGRPFVTVLTDFADYPPHFWIERQEQFLICGSQRAVEQARELGHADERIFQTSGMILNPRFYNYSPLDRGAERSRLGLEAARTTGLVLFGGQGARKKMLEIDRRLSESGPQIRLILICGKNERLPGELRAQARGIPRLIEGFTTNVPYYMQLADFFIGKPGPGSIAEALAMGLPVIVERNAWTLPQERYNASWVREKQVGLVVSNFNTVADAVAQLLEKETFAQFRCNARKMRNRALFEIPDVLSRILQESNRGDGALPQGLSRDL
ncbi:MAG: galactosyldiacylglycerol synthase [Acidobacteria bacterium]|nr:MAG: galactosyldiacylglycerol synthase [Acidobacteriota bacterium]